MTQQTRLYRVSEVAEMLAVSEKLIWKLIAQRELLDVVRIGRSVRIPAESLQRIVERGLTPARGR
jgi:excisionase family DNA binding protein